MEPKQDKTHLRIITPKLGADKMSASSKRENELSECPESSMATESSPVKLHEAIN